MFAALASFVLRLLSGGLLDKVLAHLQARADTGVERDKVTASVAIEQIRAEIAAREARRAVLMAEQGRLVTALMRPAFTYPLALYYAAVIADSLLHFRWNVAALPSPIGEWSGWIISAIFLTESGERISRMFAARGRG